MCCCRWFASNRQEYMMPPTAPQLPLASKHEPGVIDETYFDTAEFEALEGLGFQDSMFLAAMSSHVKPPWSDFGETYIIPEWSKSIHYECKAKMFDLFTSDCQEIAETWAVILMSAEDGKSSEGRIHSENQAGPVLSRAPLLRLWIRWLQLKRTL